MLDLAVCVCQLGWTEGRTSNNWLTDLRRMSFCGSFLNMRRFFPCRNERRQTKKKCNEENDCSARASPGCLKSWYISLPHPAKQQHGTATGKLCVLWRNSKKNLEKRKKNYLAKSVLYSSLQHSKRKPYYTFINIACYITVVPTADLRIITIRVCISLFLSWLIHTFLFHLLSPFWMTTFLQ